MATPELDAIWNSAFSGKRRPEVYASDEFNEDGFRPLADPLDFITDISKLTAPQLYAQAANNQIALKQAQDEYQELERLINQLKSRDTTAASSTKNPQAFPSYSEFEERKESVLYGYKYDPNRPLAAYGRWPEVTEQERRDLRSYQDPFTQGGFVPNDRQYKGILNRAKDKRNLDGWVAIEKDGKKLIPKMAPRVNEKEEYWQLSGLLPLAKGVASKPVTRSGTPDLEAVAVSGRETPVNKRLRNTRFNGAKVPLTRDVSEAPSLPVSRASTPKRKRGDTPLVLYEPNGSPVKKPRITVVDGDVQMPPRRKHHNQYTKAKEKAALEAIAAQRAVSEVETKPTVPKIVHNGSNMIAIDQGNYPWSGLTDHEKRDFHWNNDTLLLAIREDPTWLNEDAKTRLKWTKKILESKYPVRTYSMYKKWDYWRLMGEDKRPRNKKKTFRSNDVDDDEPEMDEASEMATETPSPRNKSFMSHDAEEEDDLGRAVAAVTSAPNKSGLGEVSMQDAKESGDESYNGSGNEIGSRRTSASDSGSQTISVNREEVPVINNVSRRTTRASRKAST